MPWVWLDLHLLKFPHLESNPPIRQHHTLRTNLTLKFIGTFRQFSRLTQSNRKKDDRPSLLVVASAPIVARELKTYSL